MWVAPARISAKTLTDANQFMFCGLRYRILRRMGRDALACPQDKRQNPTPSTKDEAQLNCVALRPPLDYEVAWRPVKGQDERQQNGALDSSPRHRGGLPQHRRRKSEKNNKEAVTSALTSFASAGANRMVRSLPDISLWRIHHRQVKQH